MNGAPEQRQKQVLRLRRRMTILWVTPGLTDWRARVGSSIYRASTVVSFPIPAAWLAAPPTASRSRQAARRRESPSARDPGALADRGLNVHAPRILQIWSNRQVLATFGGPSTAALRASAQDDTGGPSTAALRASAQDDSVAADAKAPEAIRWRAASMSGAGTRSSTHGAIERRARSSAACVPFPDFKGRRKSVAASAPSSSHASAPSTLSSTRTKLLADVIPMLT